MQRKERVGFAQAHGEAAGTTQFDFLLPWNEHHAFYCWARDEEARRRAKEELCGVEAELLRSRRVLARPVLRERHAGDRPDPPFPLCRGAQAARKRPGRSDSVTRGLICGVFKERARRDERTHAHRRAA